MNGYEAIFGLTLVTELIKVDLPAFGNQIIHISATSLSSRLTVLSSPTSPSSAKPGA